MKGLIMNIDIEELVCFAYQQTNKITAEMTCQNFAATHIEDLSKHLPDLLIGFLMEDHEKILIRRTALDMYTSFLRSECNRVRKIWDDPQIEKEVKKDKLDRCLGLMGMSSIKSAVLKHEEQMRASATAALKFLSASIPPGIKM